MKAFAFCSLAYVLVASTSMAQAPEAKMTAGRFSEGSVSVSPEQGVSGEYGTWTVSFMAGPEGIATGGGVRVELPDEWHAGVRNSANRLQASDPADNHYVTSSCTDEAVRLRTIVENETADSLVKHAKTSLDGRRERYVFVVRVVIEAGSLGAGETVHVTYGDTSGSSRGYLAGAVTTEPLPVLLAVDDDGTGRFQLHAQQPTLTLVPGPPVHLQCHGPSNAIAGEPIRLLVSTMDKEFNPAHDAGAIAVSVVEGDAEVSPTVLIPPNRGYAEFEATPTSSGVLYFEARSEQWTLEARSNPIRVEATAPALQVYWGDLHSHSRFSWDGVGRENFRYARYTSGLDFYAMTDHSRTAEDGFTRGLDPSSWSAYTALTERHNDPPRFVTFHAYECSFGRPFGHHNVYFRDRPGTLIAPEDHTLPELWNTLVAGDALTIPHHTGKFPDGVDFSVHDAGFRRNFEIYSAHGLSEVFDPLHPLAFEHSDFTAPAVSLGGPSHAQDAWRMGLQLSTVAASDDHRAHPGLPHWGLTAVYAEARTRDAIFQALSDRRTYATTGARILLDFRVNDAFMGQSTTVAAPPVVTIRATGTDAISRVELVRWQHGEKTFRVIETWHPDTLEFETKYEDKDYGAPSIYYVRLRQARPVLDRVAMAWSSPVWVK